MINTTTCDKCNRGFIINGVSIRPLTDDLQAQEFICPYCGARYLVLLTDSAIRQRIEDRVGLVTKQRALIAKRAREKTLRKYIKDIKQIDNDIKRMCDELRREHEAELKEYVNA